jgi:hypothetical protein
VGGLSSVVERKGLKTKTIHVEQESFQEIHLQPPFPLPPPFAYSLSPCTVRTHIRSIGSFR